MKTPLKGTMSVNGFAKVYGTSSSVTIICAEVELHPTTPFLYADSNLIICAPRLSKSLEPS